MPVLLVLTLLFSLYAPDLSRAQDPGLLSFGTRVGVGGNSPLGEEQKENFEQYDVAATFVLPWGWETASGWGWDARLIASAGELRAAGQSGFIGTLVPGLALSALHGAITLDLGVGAGLFSRYRYGVQNFGGPVQIIGTTGISFLVFRPFLAGYRFQHFSDATLWGPGTLGADIHLFEVSYRF